MPLNFIGIGAQKAGTTWLYDRLCELPGINVTPVKELHYFDKGEKYSLPNGLSEIRFRNRIKNFVWTKKALMNLAGALKKYDLQELRWLAKWYASDYDDEFYLSLFEGYSGVSGEITPSYSILDEQEIERMHSLAPTAKVIFLIRNPIHRAWSHYRYSQIHYGKEKKDKVDTKHVRKFVNSRSQEARSDYLKTLENYANYFPREQILVGFYDAIIDQPEVLLSEIVNFLSGETDDVRSHCNLGSSANSSVAVNIPPEIRQMLEEKYKEQITQLSQKMGGYSTLWYQQLYNDTSKVTPQTLKPTIRYSEVK